MDTVRYSAEKSLSLLWGSEAAYKLMLNKSPLLSEPTPGAYDAKISAAIGLSRLDYGQLHQDFEKANGPVVRSRVFDSIYPRKR